MSNENSADGKNSLMGEFLLSLARAPESVQEAIVMYGIKRMVPHANRLIYPYPMLNHMLNILNKQHSGDSSDDPQSQAS